MKTIKKISSFFIIAFSFLSSCDNDVSPEENTKKFSNYTSISDSTFQFDEFIVYKDGRYIAKTQISYYDKYQSIGGLNNGDLKETVKVLDTILLEGTYTETSTSYTITSPYVIEERFIKRNRNNCFTSLETFRSKSREKRTIGKVTFDEWNNSENLDENCFDE